MGVPKPVFWIIVVVGGILAFVLIKNSGSSSQNAAPVTQGNGGDWADDDYLANALANQGGGLGGAGLPNIPGTNANPNPQPIPQPVYDGPIMIPPTQTLSPISGAPNPIYSVPTMPTPGGTYYTPTLGSGGAYQTGPVSSPTPGGGITGRGIQGGL